MERDKLGGVSLSHCPTRQIRAGKEPCLVLFLLPSPTRAVGATNPSAHALGLSERGGKLRARAGAGGELHLFPAPRSCCSHFFPFLPCHGSEDKPAHGHPYLDPCKHSRDSIHPRARSAPGHSLPLPVHVSSISDQLCLSPTSGVRCSHAQIQQVQIPELQGVFFSAFSLEISLFLAGGSFLRPQQTAKR